MKTSLLLFSLVLPLAPRCHAAFGPAFSTGPVGGGSWIREAISTLIVPDSPDPIVGYSMLWTGMGTDNGDLIYGLNENLPPDGRGGICSNLGISWCVTASTLKSNSQLVYGSQGISQQGAQVTMHYIFNDATKQYDQSASVNGMVVSTISTDSGHAIGWGTANECTISPCGLVPAHTWINTVITLDTPDPNYISTNIKGPGVTGDITTSDGGKTWAVSTIEIPEWDFTTI